MDASSASVLVFGFMFGQACTRAPSFVPCSLRHTLAMEQRSLVSYVLRKLIPWRLRVWLLRLVVHLPGIDATLAHLIQQYAHDDPGWNSSLVPRTTIATAVGLQPSLLCKKWRPDDARPTRSISLPADGLYFLSWRKDTLTHSYPQNTSRAVPIVHISPSHDSPIPAQEHPDAHQLNVNALLPLTDPLTCSGVLHQA